MMNENMLVDHYLYRIFKFICTYLVQNKSNGYRKITKIKKKSLQIKCKKKKRVRVRVRNVHVHVLVHVADQNVLVEYL